MRSLTKLTKQQGAQGGSRHSRRSQFESFWLPAKRTINHHLFDVERCASYFCPHRSLFHAPHCPEPKNICAPVYETPQSTDQRDQCCRTRDWLVHNGLHLEHRYNSPTQQSTMRLHSNTQDKRNAHEDKRAETKFKVFHSLIAPSTNSSQRALNLIKAGDTSCVVHSRGNSAPSETR